MKTSKEMQEIISKIAEKHALDLSEIGSHLRLEQPSYMPLVVEVIGKNLVSVAHYFKSEGDLVADPDVVFFTGGEEWVAIEIQQILGYQKVAWLNDDGNELRFEDARAQAGVASFCSMWANNIKNQGWLEHGNLPEENEEASEETTE